MCVCVLCVACDCNGLASRCHFNQTLYDRTGHGGYCDECEGNTMGARCEYCATGFYRRPSEQRCTACQCHALGAESVQCDLDGVCRCRKGVTGDKCDRCALDHYELSASGCKRCECNASGSFHSPPMCDPRDGTCLCKVNVEGKNCDKPKPGFFNLEPSNRLGALPCFCYGHSASCHSSVAHVPRLISIEGGGGGEMSDVSPSLEVDPDPPSRERENTWLRLPAQFLGNLQYSYAQLLSFDMHLLAETATPAGSMVRPSRHDLVIESAAYNLRVSSSIYNGVKSQQQQQQQQQATTSNISSMATTQTLVMPSTQRRTFSFELSSQSTIWTPTLNTLDFQRMLSNVSAIKLRVTYAPGTRLVLHKVTLGSARLRNSTE